MIKVQTPRSDEELVAEFLSFGRYLADHEPMEKRQVSVRTIRAVAAALEATLPQSRA